MTLASDGLLNAKAYRYTYADATARAAASGFVAADVGVLALQLDTAVIYILTDDSPVTWLQIGGGFSNPMTTAGDIILGGSSGTPGRLAKGSDSQVLTVDPSTHLPVWATPASGGTGGQELGHTPKTSVFTSAASSSAQDITGLSVTVTIGSRPVRVYIDLPMVDTPSATANRPTISLIDVTASNAEVAAAYVFVPNGTQGGHVSFGRRLNPAAGSRTYKVQVFPDGNVATRVFCSATQPASIHVVEC